MVSHQRSFVKNLAIHFICKLSGRQKCHKKREQPTGTIEVVEANCGAKAAAEINFLDTLADPKAERRHAKLQLQA